ncbi:Uu.00g132920.m01.CDS01 [Anthostomella pinea]|uniref:Uu.00g132920.m01.CDS01 n=1 Tax=Anthostomella pinea TaxID=933095 RepID=A0AAI8VU43_9PEZI|nr:Uu.00g132920.m01.CDS01 [Anthostomella pinea]
MAAATPAARDRDGLKIINASLFRMGTKSMAQAYQLLGYKIHHGLLESDALWGQYDAVTDLASPFALELIKAYPDAKVVVLQLDFDSWWPSFRSAIRDTVMKEPVSSIQAFITSRFLGIRPVQATKKLLFGFFNAKTRLGIDEVCARKAYDAYFRDIRELVPPERRLEYKMGSGWEPLCAFLGVDVPDRNFPRENDRVAQASEAQSRHMTFLINTTKVAGPWVLGLFAIGAAWLYI